MFVSHEQHIYGLTAPRKATALEYDVSVSVLHPSRSQATHLHLTSTKTLAQAYSKTIQADRPPTSLMAISTCSSYSISVLDLNRGRLPLWASKPGYSDF